jgi:hypothetical protein
MDKGSTMATALQQSVSYLPVLKVSDKKSPSVKKLSVLLDRQLHKLAKRHAVQTDQTLTDLITSLLTEHLDKAEAIKKSPSE